MKTQKIAVLVLTVVSTFITGFLANAIQQNYQLPPLLLVLLTALTPAIGVGLNQLDALGQEVVGVKFYNYTKLEENPGKEEVHAIADFYDGIKADAVDEQGTKHSVVSKV